MSTPGTIPPTGIVLADARPLFRCGLLHVLAQAFATHQLLEVSTAHTLLDLVSSQPLRLVILSTNLPDGPARPENVLSALREAQPQVAIIVIVDPATTSELAMLRLLRQRISSLLLRTITPAEICAAVGAVLQHGSYYPAYALQLLENQLHQRPSRTAEGFSNRQLEVLRLIAADYSNEEIAEYLCTSVRTVEYHRSQMLQKAGVRTTLGLVLFAQRQGLLSLEPAPAL